MMNRKQVFSFLLIFLLALSIVKPAFAMDKNIVNEKKTVIPANEKIDNIIVLGHDIDIKGKVDISAIVINGNMKISKTAKINGIVLVINGNVVQEPGSFVKENILAFKFQSDTINHLLLGAALLFSSWLLRFVFSVGLVLLTVLTGLLIKNRGEHSLNIFKQQTGKLLLVGAISNIALIGVFLLLIFTAIGIPFAIILAIPPMVAFLMGLSILSQFIGEKLVSKLNSPNWIAIFIGSFILISILNFPFFGWIFFICIFWITTGLMIVWIIEKFIKKQHNMIKKND